MAQATNHNGVLIDRFLNEIQMFRSAAVDYYKDKKLLKRQNTSLYLPVYTVFSTNNLCFGR